MNFFANREKRPLEDAWTIDIETDWHHRSSIHSLSIPKGVMMLESDPGFQDSVQHDLPI